MGSLSAKQFSVKNLQGLSLWLKADAGTTTEAEQFISQIVISGAGTTTSNGTYIRASGGTTSFSGPNGNTLNVDNMEGGTIYFQIFDSTFEDTTYTIAILNDQITEISQSNGELQNPTATTTLSPTGNTIVTAWQDQSANTNNASPVDALPVFNVSDLNGKPTISLTSMSDYVERVFSISSNPLGASGSTAFAVQYVEDVCNASDNNGPIFGNFGGSEDSFVTYQSHYPYGPDCFVYDAFGTRLRKNEITPPVTITNAWTIYSVKSADNDWQSFVNGQLMYSDPTNTYSSAIGGDDTTLYIGKQTAGGTYSLKGKVAEVIVYNRVLTTTERQQVEAYLNEKYAIYSPIKNTKISIKKQNLGGGKINLKKS